MPLDIKTESLWYRNPDGTYTEFRAVAPAIDEELSDTSEAPVQNKIITKALNKLSQDKQNKLTFDSTPTEESDNPVTSQGIKAALDTKLDIPEEPGTPDKVLGLDENLIPHWIDKDNSEDYAPVLINSASGEIASFNDGAANRKIRKLDVHLSPIQDLHGYDSPWPAGGGVNKFGCADGSYAIGSTRTAIVTNGVWSYKVNSAATSSVFLPEATVTAMNIPAMKAGTYTFSLASNAAVSSIIAAAVLNLSDGQAITNGNSFIISADTSVVSITTPSSGEYAVGTYTCNMQIEEGSTATAWAPYSNICPISGRDSVEVEADGVNLWHGQLGNNVNVPFHATPGKTYTVTAKKVDSSLTTYLLVQKLLNGTWVTVGYVISGSQARASTFTAEADMQYSLYSNSSYTNVADIQIEPGSTATDYEPYVGTTHTIQLGETVYGGDVEIVSGNGESKMAMVDMGTLDWRYREASSVFYAPVPGKKPDNPILCSVYKASAASGFTVPDYEIATGAANNYVYVKDPRYTDAASFKAAVAGQTLAYMLATPITIQLDPVTISTIPGQTNNVWADAGDVTVDYAADLKTYIDQKIAAAVAAMS